MIAIRRDLLAWYARHGRFDLPWRTVRDPYYTLVSEFMLQQTQVDRVVPKFKEFIERFPTIRALGAATTGDVLRLWQGLGYNSRAVRLLEVAVAVCDHFGGTIPHDDGELRSLAGIGPYTAAAIASFGYDAAIAPIDTNIRRIVHRLFFGLEHPVIASPRELDERASKLVPADGGHDWNSAMMDLGASDLHCASAEVFALSAAARTALLRRSSAPSWTNCAAATQRRRRRRTRFRLKRRRALRAGESSTACATFPPANAFRFWTCIAICGRFFETVR